MEVDICIAALVAIDDRGRSSVLKDFHDTGRRRIPIWDKSAIEKWRQDYQLLAADLASVEKTAREN